ncbi:MAG TPA: CBS domain-containing protein, partial [Candidatus Saccharimonadales bacterium]|nr:CBS domain-containing protein [Candidatus Saccharimonadales bacterium]
GIATGDTTNQPIASRQELQYLVDASVGVLSSDEKNLIVHSLSFGDQLVSSVMTPRSMIDSIKSSEFLGPLTLDDLHKTGHGKLPVIKNDVDHVIGILNLQSLLALDIKRSTTAEKAMDPKVFYIRQEQSLQHALAAFLRTKHNLFIVVNEFRETVGLLSLEDVIEALLGRKIVDEFDNHDNLREVALRNPHGNNYPKKREDV